MPIDDKSTPRRYITEVINLKEIAKYFAKYNLAADGEIWYEDDPDPNPKHPGMKIAHMKTKKRK